MVQSQWPYWLPLRSDLRGISPYGAPQIKDVVSLNTNENPFPLPAEVITTMTERLSETIADLNRYPDRDATSLRTKLAHYISQSTGVEVTVENIWAANGSNEILQTLFLACGGTDHLALGFSPSYSVHPLIAQITKTPWFAGSRDGDFAIDIPKAKALIREKSPHLVFVTTPNNPSGTSTSISDLKELAEVTGSIGGLLVVDEAYAEFTTEPSAVTLLGDFPHIVVVRTMSKAFAFAGARTGYLVAKPAVVHAALITRLPYHLSALTQIAAETALEFTPTMQSEIELIISERDRVGNALVEVGYRAVPSSANFILFSGFKGEATDVWQAFLDRGILIRDVGLRGFLRVTIGSPAENDQFIAALREIAG
ncbi:MAG: histidinol-phosphate transaminase [Actinomycetota bacterium]